MTAPGAVKDILLRKLDSFLNPSLHKKLIWALFLLGGMLLTPPLLSTTLDFELVTTIFRLNVRRADQINGFLSFLGATFVLVAAWLSYKLWQQGAAATSTAPHSSSAARSLSTNTASASEPTYSPSTAPPLLPPLYQGRRNELRFLKELLGIRVGGTATQADANAIALRGWPGVGKTALATALARDPDTLQHFHDGVHWLALGQQPDLMQAFATLGRGLRATSVMRASTLSEALRALQTALQDKRLLIIIDDAWAVDDIAPFRHALSSDNALLFSTRITSVPFELGVSHRAVYNVPGLAQGSALRLLGSIAPYALKANPKECTALLQEVEFLPLAIHVAGRLLESEMRFGWGVAELLVSLREGAALINAKAPPDRVDLEVQSLPTVAALLRKSTEMLDTQTREYFAHLGPFAPKPATFDLEALAAVWNVHDARSIVRKLVDRGLLEIHGERFQMHALLVQQAKTLFDE